MWCVFLTNLCVVLGNFPFSCPWCEVPVKHLVEVEAAKHLVEVEAPVFKLTIQPLLSLLYEFLHYVFFFHGNHGLCYLTHH